jgi:membrane-associated phospholipid phosphatase
MRTLLPLISMAIFGGLLLYFGSLIPFADRSGTLIYYLNLIFQAFKELGAWLAASVLMGLVLYLTWIFLRFSLRAANLPALILLSLRHFFSSFRKQAKSFLQYAVPSIMSLIILCFLLAYVNQINSVNLKDEVLMDFDARLTGVYPFFYLVSFSLPDWFCRAVIFSFKELSLLVIIAAIYVFLKNKPVFQEFSASFCLILLLMFPLWLIFPALSPHDRFIDNVYSLPISPAVQKEVESYNPNNCLKQFLAETRTRKEAGQNPYLPTSTMPSAHAAWVVLVGYYFFRTKIFVGIISLPFLALSLLGTVFLAQHYFIDIIAGILISFIAIIIIRLLTSFESSARMVYRIK